MFKRQNGIFRKIYEDVFFGRGKWFRRRIRTIFFPGTPNKAIITKIKLKDKHKVGNTITIESGGIWCSNVTFKIITKRGAGYWYVITIYGGTKEELKPDPMNYFYSVDSRFFVQKKDVVRGAVFSSFDMYEYPSSGFL